MKRMVVTNLANQGVFGRLEMNGGDVIPSANGDRSSDGSRRKVILLAQAFFALVIVVALIRSLYAPAPPEMPSVSTENVATSTSASTKSSQLADIPRKIGGQSLLNVLTGQEAIDDMSELHGQGVGIVGGWVGHYQARGTVWVGETTDDQVAVGLMRAMVSRISVANGPFRDLRNKEIDGQKLYSATGLGQNHYFYQKGNKVIWLAMPVANEDAFLRDALNIIN